MLIFITPLVSNGYPHGNDLFYHFSRILGSVEIFKNGSLNFSVLPGFFYDFGYAVGLFYPTGLLWIPIGLNYMGIHFITSYKIFIFLITLLTMITMWVSTFRIFKRYDFAMISVIFYIFNVYRNYADLYERAALGEFIAFAFVPLAFYGIYHIVTEESDNWIYLGVGMIGLILSHTISTLLVVGLLALYVVLNIKQIVKTPKIILTIFISIIFTSLLTAFYWLPMLEMMASDHFYYQQPWTHIDLNVLTHFVNSIYVNTDISLFPYGIEIYALLIVLIGLLVKFKVILKHQFLRFSLIAGILSLLIAANGLPIQWFKFLDFMQFPWRFFMFVDYFFAILIGYILSSINNQKWRNFGSILFISIVLFQYLNYSNYYIQVRMRDYIYTDFVRYDFSGREFLPSSVDIEFLSDYSNDKTIQSNQNISIEYARQSDGYVIKFDQLGLTQTILEIPLVYYKGYVAYYMGIDGEEFLDIYKNEQSLISVDLEEHPNGSIKVFYNGTRISRLGLLISSISLGFLIIWLILYLVKVSKKILYRQL